MKPPKSDMCIKLEKIIKKYNLVPEERVNEIIEQCQEKRKINKYNLQFALYNDNKLIFDKSKDSYDNETSLYDMLKPSKPNVPTISWYIETLEDLKKEIENQALEQDYEIKEICIGSYEVYTEERDYYSCSPTYEIDTIYVLIYEPINEYVERELRNINNKIKSQLKAQEPSAKDKIQKKITKLKKEEQLLASQRKKLLENIDKLKEQL